MEYYLYYYALLFVFGVIAYMIVVDKNVATFIILLGKMARVSISRFIFWVKFYPRLRYDTFWLKRKSKKALNALKQEQS
jgi:hypothetical protein